MQFPAYRTFLIACGAVLVTALWLGLERTRFGAQGARRGRQPAMAQSMGINTRGCSWSPSPSAAGSRLSAARSAPTSWRSHRLCRSNNLVYFLIVVAVGGLGSIRGPFLAAVLVGVADTACKYLVPEFGAFFIYARRW